MEMTSKWKPSETNRWSQHSSSEYYQTKVFTESFEFKSQRVLGCKSLKVTQILTLKLSNLLFLPRQILSPGIKSNNAPITKRQILERKSPLLV
jgi:hypothetical protein